MGFSVVFVNVLVMLAYMACGFGIVKSRKAVSSHAKSFSAFLLYVCAPCMIINSFQSMEYSIENFKKVVLFFVVTLIVQLLFFVILYILLHKKYDDAKYRILTVGSILGNVGFFGMPLVNALFPGNHIVACYSMVYVVSMNFLVFTAGVFMITGDRKFISLKSAILNPTTLSVLVAVPMYLLKIKLPDTVGSMVSILGNASTPVCMVILGMRLASVSLKKVFTRPFAYVVCLMKLIIFPVFAYACVAFLPFLDKTFKICVLAMSAAPSASVILSLAELHEVQQELSANVVLITTLLSLITLPVMLMIV